MTRTERQQTAINRWILAGGQNTIIGFTGFGKTYLSIQLYQRFIRKNPKAKILIVVPTQVLKEQWEKSIKTNNLEKNCEVQIINSVIKKTWTCDLLTVDEAHKCASPDFRKVFTCVDYQRLLCLTATLKRLDGLERVIEYYAPVCDEITLEEGLKNGWVSEYLEYKILLDVDLTEYNKIDLEFFKHFSFFNHNFDLALSLIGNINAQINYSRTINVPLKMVKAHLYSFMRLMNARKNWVMNHPQKIIIAKKIIEARKDKKILTFSSSIDLAKLLDADYIIHSKKSKKVRSEILKEYTSKTSGVLSSVDALREGMDVPGVSVAILVGFNSSMLKKIQTVGRVIRKEDDKKAEVFTLVIKGTTEEAWFAKSSKDINYITLDENDLDNLLNNNNVRQSDALYFE